MPKYGTFKFGRIAKYGRYTLQAGSSKAIGEYVRYKMRNHNSDGRKTPYVSMGKERIEVPADGTIDRFRLRCNNGVWTYMQSVQVNAETFKVRIRSLESDGGMTPWVYGQKANLKYT